MRLFSNQGDDNRLAQIDANAVVSAFDTWFLSKWSGLLDDPRSAASDQVLACVYSRWFALPWLLLRYDDYRRILSALLI